MLNLIIFNCQGPANYNLTCDWPGKKKEGDKDAKPKKNWMNNLSKGVELGIYHSIDCWF